MLSRSLFEEHRNSGLIARALTEWGHPRASRVGWDRSCRDRQRRAKRPKTTGLRADIDALPMTEYNTFSDASVYVGKMDACGHDGHTAMRLAAAKYLSTHRHFDRTVYLIFQPAEEVGGGAREMIKDGLFARFPMDAIFGMHYWLGLGVGAVCHQVRARICIQ